MLVIPTAWEAETRESQFQATSEKNLVIVYLKKQARYGGA
jgi:hypothetical protein